MVDTATGYPLHPQEDLETNPDQSGMRPSYADAYQPPASSHSVPNSPTQHNQAPNQTTATHTRPEGLIPGYAKPIAEETIVEWQALSRPFKKRSRQYFTTVAVLVILISLILFFAGQFLPIAVVVSVAFLAYVLSVVPPGMANHSITTYGIRVENSLYYWDELGRFWFTEKYGHPLLHIEVSRFPGRITLLLGDIPQEEMKELLSEVLLNQKPEPTLFDKAADWIQEKIPLEAEHHPVTPPPPTSDAQPTPPSPPPSSPTV